MENIPVFEPTLLGNEWEYVKGALDGNYLSGTSPVIREFEKRFAQFSGSQYAVATANGTAALHLSMLSLDLKPGDEVIVPDFTIISNALAVTLCGAKPVFVDVSPKDWCLDVRQLEAAVTPRTRGVMAVHMFGQPCDLDALGAFCRAKNLWLVEDAAQAPGATWQQRPVGSFGVEATYSFYANKLITTGEGGAVTTNDETLYRRLKTAVNLGFDPDPSKRFIHAQLTHNYRMSSMQAAVGIAQVERVDELLAARERIRTYYRDALGEPRGFSLPQPDGRGTSAFWMCALSLDPDTAVTIPRLQQKLAERGIDTRRFFYPLHRQPALLEHHNQRDAAFPVTERLFDRGIYLPSSPGLTWEQVRTIVETFKQSIA